MQGPIELSARRVCYFICWLLLFSVLIYKYIRNCSNNKFSSQTTEIKLELNRSGLNHRLDQMAIYHGEDMGCTAKFHHFENSALVY